MQYVYAHRGASGYAPENTLRAFAVAADMGADGVELDVQRTRDGVLVVFHDETVDRVTHGHGRIADMTLAELRQLRVDRPFPEITDEVIPTLEEVYTLLHDRGLRCNAELKNSVLPYPGLEEEAIAMAEKTGMADKLLYSSFNHYSMCRIKALNPAMPCGLLYNATLVKPWDYAAGLGVDALHPHRNAGQALGLCCRSGGGCAASPLLRAAGARRGRRCPRPGTGDQPLDREHGRGAARRHRRRC